GARPIDFAGGLIVGFYVLSITVLAPAFGVGNAILFVMVAQIFTSAAIDHFALFGAALRPVSLLRALGLVVLLVGLAISQLADRGSAR
ncbi:DMT family transporter, partial [Staphylococcus aureus]